MTIIKNIMFCSFLFFHGIVLSQVISGIVYDGETKKPLEGASIYFNNTTYGTTTNLDGIFGLVFNKDIKTPLIISFIGYETVILDEFSTIEKLKIYLKESTDVLNEVVLTFNDGWTRKLKLKEFRKHYLGESKNGMSCKILNEDDIILRYNKSKKLLTAKISKPLIIKNNNLKYLITSYLQHFEVSYSHVSKSKLFLNINYVYYTGNNYYKSMEDFPSKGTNKKREGVYLGSTLHFMRSMANNSLKKENYQILHGDHSINYKKYFTITPFGDNLVKVTVKDKLNVVFNQNKKSSFECIGNEFYIDNFGKHFPPERVKLGGDFGNQRMGDSLPLDFLLKPNM